MNAAQGSGWATMPPEMRQRVMGFVTIPQLAALGATSRQHYFWAKSEVGRRVNGLLDEWQLPREPAKDIMRTEKIVFSGSAILGMMDRSFKPRDLDGYVPRGRIEAVEEFLKNHTQYVKVMQDDAEYETDESEDEDEESEEVEGAVDFDEADSEYENEAAGQ
ncbi:hypothetical protein MD484_g3162, partial [Candolleomyces efflorescens]